MKTISITAVIYTAAVWIISGIETAPAYTGLHAQAVSYTLMDYHQT